MSRMYPTTTRRLLRSTGAGVLAAATASTAAILGAGPASAAVEEPSTFTSAYTVAATPSAIVDTEGQSVPGDDGASGSATLRVNSELDVICWDVRVRDVEGALGQAGATSMRIFEAPAGFTGPSRIAVPDPEGDEALRTGSGCAQGPFVSGVEGADGQDTGTGFTMADLEADPTAYSWDLSSEAYPTGAIRGQFVRVPLGGLETGFGGTQPEAMSGVVRTVGAAGSAAVVLLAGVVLLRRQRVEE